MYIKAKDVFFEDGSNLEEYGRVIADAISNIKEILQLISEKMYGKEIFENER